MERVGHVRVVHRVERRQVGGKGKRRDRSETHLEFMLACFGRWCRVEEIDCENLCEVVGISMWRFARQPCGLCRRG